METKCLHLDNNLGLLSGMGDGIIDLVICDPFYYSSLNKFEPEDLPIPTAWDKRPIKNYLTMRTFRYLRDLLNNTDRGTQLAVGTDIQLLIPRLIEMHRVMNNEASIYLHCKPKVSPYIRLVMDSIFGIENFQNQIIWCYPPSGQGPKYGFHRKHDVILFYSKNADKAIFNRQYTDMPAESIKAYSQMDIKERSYKKFQDRRSYLDQKQGRPVPSWWADIFPFSVASNSKERLDYPQQKPKALYERIIRSSSNPDHTVLDPYCGSGTVIDVAQGLKRNWIGIDMEPKAIEITIKRLGSEYGLIPHKDYSFDGESTKMERVNMPKPNEIREKQFETGEI